MLCWPGLPFFPEFFSLVWLTGSAVLTTTKATDFVAGITGFVLETKILESFRFEEEDDYEGYIKL